MNNYAPPDHRHDEIEATADQANPAEPVTFAEDILFEGTSPPPDGWKILIVDDEVDVHSASQLALDGIIFNDKPVLLLDAYSGAEGREMLIAHPDIALIFLDVVMETTSAGLELVRFIRQTLNNNLTQIVLRTGYPGQSPEKEVITIYDINSYETKTELTVTKLYTLVISGLRAYNALHTIDTYRRDLEEQIKVTQQQLIRQERLAAVGELAAGIAHDFNNLLTVINGFTQLLQSKQPPQSEAYVMAGKILAAGQQAANLVNQLLTFSRKQIIRPRFLTLNAIIMEMEASLRQIIDQDIFLDLKLGPEPGLLKVDPRQIEQLIINITLNALDAMPDGGILTITTSNVILNNVDFASHRERVKPGQYALLAIADTGQGMTQEVQTRMFEPFFSTKPFGSTKGTGLGLATVYGIVKQYQGYIEVDSYPGQGTAFKIYLPCGDVPPARDRLLEQTPG